MPREAWLFTAPRLIPSRRRFGLGQVAVVAQHQRLALALGQPAQRRQHLVVLRAHIAPCSALAPSGSGAGTWRSATPGGAARSETVTTDWRR